MSILARPTLLVVALLALTIGALFIVEKDTAMAAGPTDLRIDMASSKPLPAPGEQVFVRTRVRNMGPNTVEDALVVINYNTYSFDGFCLFKNTKVGTQIVQSCDPVAGPPPGVTCVDDPVAKTLTCTIASLGSPSVPGSGPTYVLISGLFTAEPAPDGRPYISGTASLTTDADGNPANGLDRDTNPRNNAARASTNSLP